MTVTNLTKRLVSCERAAGWFRTGAPQARVAWHDWRAKFGALLGTASRRDRIAQPEVLLVQTAAPDYRSTVLKILTSNTEVRIAVCAGDDYFDPTVRTAVDDVTIQRLRNRFLFGRRLLWQGGFGLRVLRVPVVVAELNPRILSTWVILATRRALGRPTILWGHAWPRRGQHSRTDGVRQLQRSLASALIVYTRTEAHALQARTKRVAIFVAPNAISGRGEITPVFSEADPSQLLCTGRLVPAKKPLLLLEAFASACIESDFHATLVYVGDGPLRGTLEDRVDELSISDRVRFLGHVPPAKLSQVFESAFATVSPGYVGLSLTQSLAYGVPMLIASDEPHSPEIEAAMDGENALFFRSDSARALAEVILRVWRERTAWRMRSPQIASRCNEEYSAEAMARGVLSAIGHCRPTTDVTV